MNKIIASIILSSSLFMACNNQANQQKEPEQQSKRNAVIETIHSRKSVRNFVEGKSVAKEDIDILIKAAMAAPTAVNLQPWHFIVVDNRGTLDSLNSVLPYAKMLKNASFAIIVCGDTTIKAGNMAFWEFDCSLASANILLAAEAMDLGAVWTAVHPDQGRIDAVRQQLQLPDNIIPLNVIPVGYPTGEDKAKDKYKPERVHFNKWENK